MGSKLRIVHLSDFHFGASPNLVAGFPEKRNPIAVLRSIRAHNGSAMAGDEQSSAWFRPATHATRAARDLARYLETSVERQLRPAAVVVTGDLATTGESDDLNVAFNFVNNGSRGAWINLNEDATIGGIRDIVKLLPGNHDRYDGALLLPGGRNFNSIFSSYWKPSSSCGRVSCEIIGSAETSAILVSLDLSLTSASDGSPPSIVGYIGTGKAYEATLRAAEHLSESFAESVGTKVIIWAVHFAPGFPNCDNRLRLHDDHLFIAAARRAGVSLILAGHTHVAACYRVDGIPVDCVGSACQADPEVAWHFSVCAIEIERQQAIGIKSLGFSFDSDVRDFVPGKVSDFSATNTDIQ